MFWVVVCLLVVAVVIGGASLLWPLKTAYRANAHHEALSFALSKVHARESDDVHNMKQEILDRYQHAGRAEMLLHLDKLIATVRESIERPIFDAAYMDKDPSDAIDKWVKEP